MRELFLGVDGGGSKTSCLVCDREGNELAAHVGESINYYALGLESARVNMRECIRALQSGLNEAEFTAAFIGMSALNGRATQQELHAFCDGIIPAKRMDMDSDLFIALEAAQAEGAAMVVISGTGSMAVARDEAGQILTSGGWGHTLGDEGSGYWLALHGIQAAIRGQEGSAAETALTKAVLEHFGIMKIEALIDLFYDPPMEKAHVAAFAPEVCRLAGEGDSVACVILERGANELAETARVLCKKLPANTPIHVWGGIFEHVALFRALFSRALEQKIALLPNPPVMGAVEAARRLSWGDR